MTRVAAIAMLLAGALVAASCAGTPVMAPSTAEALAQGTAAVRTAVESGDRDAAEAALEQLRASVDDFGASDAITDEKMLDILAAVSEVEAALDVMPTTTTTTDDDDDDEGNGKGKGKSGKSHGKG